MTKAEEIIFDYNSLELDEAFYKTFKILDEANVVDECPDKTTSLDEEFTVLAMIGLVMAMPNIVKMITKAFGFIIRSVKKLFGKSENNPKFIDKIIVFTAKWHDAYVKVLQKILFAAGVFRAAKLKDPEKQRMATEVLYYTIVLGLAVYGGVGTAEAITKAIQQSSLVHGKVAAVEGVLTSLKSTEIKNFIQQLRA